MQKLGSGGHTAHSVKLRFCHHSISRPTTYRNSSESRIFLLFPDDLAEYSFIDQRPKDFHIPHLILANTQYLQQRCVSGQQQFFLRPSAGITAHRKGRTTIRIGRYGRANMRRRSDRRRNSGNHAVTSSGRMVRMSSKALSPIDLVQYAGD